MTTSDLSGAALNRADAEARWGKCKERPTFPETPTPTGPHAVYVEVDGYGMRCAGHPVRVLPVFDPPHATLAMVYGPGTKTEMEAAALKYERGEL